jgi:hypothetical protein
VKDEDSFLSLGTLPVKNKDTSDCWTVLLGMVTGTFHWCDVGWMKEYFDHYFLEEHMKLCHFRNHYEVYSILIFC